VRLVAGLSADDEPLFTGPDRFFEARRDFGSWFAANVLPPEAGVTGASTSSEPAAASPEEFDPKQFMTGFSKEIASLQLLAIRRGNYYMPERPIRAGGLIPSADGLHWQRV